MELLQVDWQYILIASFAVTGVIQWLKSVITNPTNVWGYLSPIICVGVSLLVNGGWMQVIYNTIIILAVSQLGYDVLVKPIKKFLGVIENAKAAQ